MAVSEYLEHTKDLALVLSLIVIPVVVAFLGNKYTKSIKEREVEGRFVELAINILNQAPTEKNQNLRTWAAQIIDRYSGVPLSDTTRNDLINNISFTEITGLKIPYRKVLDKRKVEEIIAFDTHTRNLGETLRALESGNTFIAYHYLIDLNGEITKIVDESNIVANTPGHNDRSVSIGLIHIQKNDAFERIYTEFTEPQLNSLTDLIVDISRRHHIKIENIFSKQEISSNKIHEITAHMDKIRKAVELKLSIETSDLNSV